MFEVRTEAPSTPEQELRAVYEQAYVLADGEAIDACTMLLAAVKTYLDEVEA